MGADEPKSCSDALFGRRARKIGFIFIILFLTALTMKDVKELVEEYLEWPKESDINIVFNESMSMPNITFCMSRPQAWSHFKLNESAPADEWDMVVDENLANMTTHDSFLNTLWDYRMVMEAYDMIATYNSLERETTAHGSARSINVFRVSPRLAAKRKTFKKWHEVLADRDVTFEELTQKVGTEVLRRSMQRFQRTTFDENLIIKTRLRTSWISMMQLCFQPMFDADNLHPIEDQGNFFTMLLSHNAENLNNKSVDCMSVDFHGRPSSLNRFMEGKGRARDGYIDELCLGQRHEVTVHVTNLYQMLENDDEGTACRDVEEDEDSEFDCRSRCRMEMIRDMCNCTGQSLAYLVDDDDELKKFPLCDYTQCVVDVQQGNYSDSECSAKCYHDCRQIRYEVDHAVKGRMVRPDLTMVELNWGSFEYLTMEQQWKYTVSSFIAALGGAIGMWLGLSILSLIQLGSYCYTYLKNRFAKSKVGDADEGSADIEVDVGGTKKKMSMAENPFESPFGSGSPPPVKKSSNTRRASGDQGSVGYSSNPNGSSTVKIN